MAATPEASQELGDLQGTLAPRSTDDKRHRPRAVKRKVVQSSAALDILQGNKQAAGDPTVCPALLPLLDKLRTYCYEHQIEEIPALLAV